MAGIPFSKGFIPVQHVTQSGYTPKLQRFQVASTSGATDAAVYTGQVVMLDSNGYVTPVVGLDGTETVGEALSNVVGVVAGVFWMDPTDNIPVERKYAPAGQTTGNGYYDGVKFEAANNNGSVAVRVITDPNQLYAVKSTSTVGAQGASGTAGYGERVSLLFNGTGSSYSGQSDATVTIWSDDTTSGGAVTVQGTTDTKDDAGELEEIGTIVDIWRGEDYVAPSTSPTATDLEPNTWGTPETIVIVKLDKPALYNSGLVGFANTELTA